MAVVGNKKSASSNRKTGLTKSSSSAKGTLANPGGGVVKPKKGGVAKSPGPTTSPKMSRTPGPASKNPSPIKNALVGGAKVSPKIKPGGQKPGGALKPMSAAKSMTPAKPGRPVTQPKKYR